MTDVAELVVDDPTHGRLPATVWRAAARDGLPVCLFLYGGGGSERTLVELAPALQAATDDGRLPPMVIACLGVPPFCFYLDDPRRGVAWETAVAESLVAEVGRRHAVDRVGLVGISMGGYGALKIAFARPEPFAAVAAIAPMVEPSTDADATPLRNRWHYPPQCPAALVGPQRDAALFQADHPVTRARRHAARIAGANQAIRIDAGSRDALCAHDGAEYLHRELWALDLPHDYHLHRDADHVGPTMLPRLLEGLSFVGRHLGAPATGPSPEEHALRDMLRDARRSARALDPTLRRTYGPL